MSTTTFARFARLLSQLRFESAEVLSWPAPWISEPDLAKGARAFEPRLNVSLDRARIATLEAARAYRDGIAIAIVGSTWTAFLYGSELVSIEDPRGNELERSIVVVLAEKLASEGPNGETAAVERLRCGECSATGTVEEFEKAGQGVARCPACASRQVRRELELDLCPACRKPCHATEATDSGEHPACFTARTGEWTFSGDAGAEVEPRVAAVALDEIQRLAVEALVEASGSWPPSSTTFARALRKRLEGSAAPGAYHAARALRVAVREELEATRDVARLLADAERFALEWDAENAETDGVVGLDR